MDCDQTIFVDVSVLERPLVVEGVQARINFKLILFLFFQQKTLVFPIVKLSLTSKYQHLTFVQLTTTHSYKKWYLRPKLHPLIDAWIINVNSVQNLAAL